jgi:hypothetical protein
MVKIEKKEKKNKVSNHGSAMASVRRMKRQLLYRWNNTIFCIR